MGSGISLSDKQVCQIVKRDLSIEYHTLCAARSGGKSIWELCKNQVDDVKYIGLNKYVDSIYKKKTRT